MGQSQQQHEKKDLIVKLYTMKGKINTNFLGHKLTKEGSHWICFSVILTDSAFRTSKSYYPQVFLEEGKYIIEEKKKYIP